MLVRVDLQTNVPQILTPLPPLTYDNLAQAGKDDFYPWQFERHLNSAADLLDRANEDRSALLAILASDLELRLSLEASELAIKQQWERFRLSNAIPNPPDYEALVNIALSDPIAYGALSAWMASKQEGANKGIVDEYNSQKSRLGNNIAVTAAARPDVTETMKNEWLAQQFAATAAELQYVAGSVTPRAKDAEREELKRTIQEVVLAREQHNKRVEAASNGGVLDLRYEATLIALRMLRDFDEALMRLSAAQEGLRTILGRGLVRTRITPALPVLDAIAGAQNYVRELILWHALKTQHDQGFTVTVSVREYCTAAVWQDFLRGTTVKLAVDPRAFATWALPRLRSLSAAYTGTDTRTVSMAVKPPRRGLRTDNQAIPQDVPACRLGRVNNIASPREPESNGAVTLMNVCPVQADAQSWEVTLQRFGPKTGTWDYAIDDVILELACVGVPSEHAWQPEPPVNQNN